MPNDLTLHINTLCHTLSEDLEMSTKFSVNFKGGLQLNNLQIPWTIDSSWHSHESEGLKPDQASLRSFH